MSHDTSTLCSKTHSHHPILSKQKRQNTFTPPYIAARLSRSSICHMYMRHDTSTLTHTHITLQNQNTFTSPYIVAWLSRSSICHMYMSHDTSTPCHTNTLTSPHNIMTVAMFIGVCVGEVCCWCMCVCSTISQDTCISPYNIKTHSHHPILSKYIHITLYYQNTYIKTHAYHPIISKHIHITLYYQNTFTSPYIIKIHTSRHMHITL